MSMAVGPNQGIKNEINVTPLVDVVLVLLIIFMVVTPMLQRGKDVRLPKAENISPTSDRKGMEPIILSVTPDKKVYYDKFEYPDEALKDKLTQELVAAPGRQILLKGDQSLSFGDIRRVMKIAKDAKATGIQLGVEEIKK